MNRLSLRNLAYAIFFCLLFTSSGNIDYVYGSSKQEVLYLPLVLKRYSISSPVTPTASPTGPKPTKDKTSTPTRTQTRTSTPYRSPTPLPTSTITPTTTLTPTPTFTPTLTPTPTYIPMPEFTLIYPTFTPSFTPTIRATVEPTNTQTPAPLFENKSNQARLGILVAVGLVWVLLAIWLIILIRRTRTSQEK